MCIHTVLPHLQRNVTTIRPKGRLMQCVLLVIVVLSLFCLYKPDY